MCAGPRHGYGNPRSADALRDSKSSACDTDVEVAVGSAYSLRSFISADGELVNVQRCPRYLRSLPVNGRRT